MKIGPCQIHTFWSSNLFLKEVRINFLTKNLKYDFGNNSHSREATNPPKICPHVKQLPAQAEKKALEKFLVVKENDLGAKHILPEQDCPHCQVAPRSSKGRDDVFFPKESECGDFSSL